MLYKNINEEWEKWREQRQQSSYMQRLSEKEDEVIFHAGYRAAYEFLATFANDYHINELSTVLAAKEKTHREYEISEKEKIHIIKTGFHDTYIVVWEDAEEVTLGQTELLRKQDIEDKFKIKL